MSQSEGPSLLDTVSVAAPCPANWTEMRGDDRVRFCTHCDQSVYDLSALSRGEAEELIRGTTGRTCARLYRRQDGTVITRDCPAKRMRAAARRMAGIVVGAIVLVLTGIGWAAARSGTRSSGTGAVVRIRSIEPFRTIMDWIEPPEYMIMGELECPPSLPATPPAAGGVPAGPPTPPALPAVDGEIESEA